MMTDERDAAGSLSDRTDAELLAHVLGGGAPSAAVAGCAARVARIPLWERRVLGASGLVRHHGVSRDRAVRLAALWERVERGSPEGRRGIAPPRGPALVLGALRPAAGEGVGVLMLAAR